MINVRIVLDKDGQDHHLEFLAESVEVRDATGDDSLRLRVVDGGTIRFDTAPM